jgi:hypothetical protein
MEAAALIQQMRLNADRIRAQVDRLPEDQARWKPDPETWSIQEVLAHLLDEEREDFRVRLDIILHSPEKPWPPIDPMGWVEERAYNQRDLAETINDFLIEREKSLSWLSGLDNPDWGAVYQARFGPITAGDMFAAWAGHDLLHLRQLVELHWAYLEKKSEPYSARYAGEW